MTLTEALKSGRRFRREGGCAWHRSGPWTDGDVLADDYQLEPVAVMVTMEQLRLAVLKVIPTTTDRHLNLVCMELGL